MTEGAHFARFSPSTAKAVSLTLLSARPARVLRTLANLPRGGVRRRGANNVGEGYAGLRQQAKQASPRRVGFPLPHPDAIEIKTVPEQIIIKVLALYIDEGGCSGRETRPLRCNARVYRQQNICTKPIIEASFACISMKANVRDGRPVPYIAMPVYAGIKHLHKQIIEVSFAYFSFQRKGGQREVRSQFALKGRIAFQ